MTGPFTTVAVGGHYAACALTEAGEAVCWNANDPLEVETLPGRYIAIDAAEGTTCAVKENGEAVCWGSDESAADAPPGPYTAISTTNGYTCALREDGEAACWAWAATRSKDDPLERNPYEDELTQPPPGTLLAISSSEYRSCAVNASGEAVRWGDVDYATLPGWLSLH